eukprot:scaffold153350_cov30-Tisochrysis_lutea.AAC.1
MSPGNGSAISELDETHDMGWEDDASRWESDADGDSGYEEELEEDQPADESTLSDSSADAAAAGATSCPLLRRINFIAPA